MADAMAEDTVTRTDSADTKTTHALNLISALTPSASTRAWQSAPHPYLPLVATACSDKTVRIYSLATFNLVSTIAGGHKRSVRAVAWKPGTKGESVLATGSFDASAGIWKRWDDAAGGGLGLGGENSVVNGESTHDMGNNEEEEEDEDGEEGFRFSIVLDGHDSEIKSVAWSASGSLLATCSRDKSVWIWEEIDAASDEFETVAVLQDHDADVKCVVWHPTEELLASASYDDTIRLWREDVDDWGCVTVLKGHESTVWAVDFEPHDNPVFSSPPLKNLADKARPLLHPHDPRLISSSDDRTIRIWRRLSKPVPSNPYASHAPPPTGQGRMPSIIRPSSPDEDWIQECVLPAQHDRAIYSVAWSKRSGRVVSAGGDGRLVVYEEQVLASGDRTQDQETLEHGERQVEGQAEGKADADADADGEAQYGHDRNQAEAEAATTTSTGPGKTSWQVLCSLENAHGVFELNHVCWATLPRGRRLDGRRNEDGPAREKGEAEETGEAEGHDNGEEEEEEEEEEIILTTGDDGAVRAWRLSGCPSSSHT
ncbi:MAG: hypothetical protein M1819_005035 [Sarea resinae]|nr:MAG: hypothetical protein M1819_005035 [Sarea resinae]